MLPHGLLPASGALLGGRADLPAVGFEETAGAFATPSPPGARVLWIGNPLGLPGNAFQAGTGTSAFVTTTALPSPATLWPTADPGPAGDATADVAAAVNGRTLRLGSLLSPLGIRFLVVPTSYAPTLVGEQSLPLEAPPPGLVRALQAQTDLRQLPTEDGVLVWENASWTPADRTGTLAPPPSSSWPRALGVAGGILVIVACIAEGMARRRRFSQRRTSRSAGGVPAGAAEEPMDSLELSPGASRGALGDGDVSEPVPEASGVAAGAGRGPEEGSRL